MLEEKIHPLNIFHCNGILSCLLKDDKMFDLHFLVSGSCLPVITWALPAKTQPCSWLQKLSTHWWQPSSGKAAQSLPLPAFSCLDCGCYVLLHFSISDQEGKAKGTTEVGPHITELLSRRPVTTYPQTSYYWGKRTLNCFIHFKSGFLLICSWKYS